jgi:nucleotide-binding universal stress UspA family protein
MLKSILIGLEGSPHSNAAVELGIQWAKRFDALLVGLGIVNLPVVYEQESELIGRDYFSGEQSKQLLEHDRRKIEEFLEDFARRCAEAGVAYNLLKDTGLPYEEILRESQRYDMVLLGHETNFHFGLKNRPDETLWHVLKRVPRPVTIAPAKLERGSSVVVAYNGSPQADHALQAFQASGLDFDEEVHVVSVNEDQREAERQTNRAVEFLRLHQIKALPHALQPADSVCHSILAEVRRLNARLLVMGAYGHSTIREFLLGSLTNSVLKDSPVPVFLCR